MGHGGLGFVHWGLGIGPNPQSPIPNPQSPIPISPYKIIINLYKLLFLQKMRNKLLIFIYFIVQIIWIKM